MKTLNLKLLSAALTAVLAMSAAHAAVPSSTAAPVVRAKSLLASTPGKAQSFANAGDAFTATDLPTGAGGVEHVRFERTYKGLPVIGGDLVVHSRNGVLLSVTQKLKTTQRPASLAPKITAADAMVEAGADLGTDFQGTPTASLVIAALDGNPALAYQVRLLGTKRDRTPTDMRYLIDANTGRVLAKWDTVHTAEPGGGGVGCTAGVPAKGTGQSLYLGTVQLDTVKCGSYYQLLDKTRGGGYTVDMAGVQSTAAGVLVTDTDNKWGNGQSTSRQTDAADAHFGVAATWDYFKSAHGRNGIANDGKGAKTRVHYGVGYQNAFWADGCFCMTFGDTMTALDVAGHEMSHGVTSRSAKLVYSGDAGGLNEATSDIFGTAVEFFVNDAARPPNYLIGEELGAIFGGDALRYMFKPSLDGQSFDCYSSAVTSADPHYSSGVGNHFFYLLAEGAKVPAGYGAGTKANLTPAGLVCNGDTSLAGIGQKDAAKIWYLALTAYFTANTTYPEARVATLNAARDLFGADSAQYRAVAATWSAVSVESAS